jgi:hypothetical protein
MRTRLDTFIKRHYPAQEPACCVALIDEIINHTPRGKLYRSQLLASYKGDERIDASLLLDDLLEEKRQHFQRYNQLNLLGEVRS